MKVAVKNAIIAVLLLFFVYGFFFPKLPVVNPDELWETSRGYYVKTQHNFFTEDWQFKEQKRKYSRRIRIVQITNNC